MRFVVKQKMFSFVDRFNITDEIGRPKYIVESDYFTIGRKLNIYDMEENHLIYIEQAIFKLLPEYFLYENEEVVARITKELTLFKPRINIESVYGNFIIDGSIMGYNFTIERDGEIVARISKEVAFSDTYIVDIEDANEGLILAIAIVIDQMLHGKS